MSGAIYGLGFFSGGFIPGRVPSRNTLNLNTLQTELQNVTNNNTRREIILRHFGTASPELPEDLSGYTRQALTGVFCNLQEALENSEINLPLPARIRLMRFLSGLADKVADHIRSNDPFDESRLSYEQYNENYERTANAFESISRIPTIPRTPPTPNTPNTTIRVPAGTFSNLPYHELLEGINFNSEIRQIRNVAIRFLTDVVNSVPEDVEIAALHITQENHGAIEQEFKLLRDLVTNMGNTIMPSQSRAAYRRLLQLCATYAGGLSEYHRENNNEEQIQEYSQMRTRYSNLFTRETRQAQELALPTGPETRDSNHRLTFLFNRVQNLQSQLERETTPDARNNLRRDLIMQLFGDGVTSPQCPRTEDFYHRGRATVVFHELLASTENPDINIPVNVRARALRFLATYAENFASHLDGKTRENNPDANVNDIANLEPSITLFFRYCTTLRSAADSLEAISQIPERVDNLPEGSIYLPLRNGTLQGIPYRLYDLPEGDNRRNIESPRFKRLLENALVTAINHAENHGVILRAPVIRNDAELQKAIEELENLSRLAGNITFRNNNSPETTNALPHMWRLCSSYALSIHNYHDSRSTSRTQGYGIRSSYFLGNAHLTRNLPRLSSGEASSNQNQSQRLPQVTLPLNLVMLDHMLLEANTSESKINLIRGLFEGDGIVFSAPDSFSGSRLFHEDLFNRLRNILEDPNLNIDIATRARGFKFLSGFAENYARQFTAGSEFACNYSRLSTRYNAVATALLATPNIDTARRTLVLLAPQQLPSQQPLPQQLPQQPPPQQQPPQQPPPQQPPLQQPPPQQPPSQQPLPQPPQPQPPQPPPQQPPPLPPLPGSFCNVQINGQTIQLHDFSSGPPPQNQLGFYQRTIRFSCAREIPVTYTGNGHRIITSPNPELLITNIRGVCCIYRRRNQDETYRYSIGVDKNYTGTIEIGERVIFPNNN